MQYSHINYTNRKINTQCWPAVAGTVAVSHRRSPPPAQEDCGGVDRRGRMSATVRSSGDQLETVLLAGASGEQGTGAGEEGESGGLQAELEGLEADSDRRESSRRRRESGEEREVPAVASGVCSRPRQSRSWPAVFVRLQRRLPAARGGSAPLRVVLRCFPDDQVAVLLLERGNAVCGSTVSCRRPGELSAAPRLGWSLPEDCWDAGEGVWMVG